MRRDTHSRRPGSVRGRAGGGGCKQSGLAPKGPVDQTIRAATSDQGWLLAPSLDDRLPDGPVARFVAELVDEHPVGCVAATAARSPLFVQLCGLAGQLSNRVWGWGNQTRTVCVYELKGGCRGWQGHRCSSAERRAWCIRVRFACARRPAAGVAHLTAIVFTVRVLQFP